MVDYITFHVNGKEIIERHPQPDWTLLWYLRNKLRLTGSKLGCGDGGCGACTVFVSQCIDEESGEIEHRTINACLAPLCSVDGCHVVTIEGLGSVDKSNLHPTQKRVAELYASQCGFCTPGMVMSLYGTMVSKMHHSVTLEDIEEGFDGNLCRCTGYRPILDAGKTFADNTDQLPEFSSSSSTVRTKSTTRDKCNQWKKETKLPIDQVKFPEKLLKHAWQSIHIKGSSMDWYRPVQLKELLELRHTYPGNQSKLVFGNTRVQLQRKYEHVDWPRLISINQIKELQEIRCTEESFYLGAGVTFSRLKAKLIEWNNQPDGFCQALLDQLKYFASTQIRNVASLGGNIMSASPISDINPVLIAAGAILEFHRFDRATARHIPLKDFYVGHRQVSIEDNEVLVAIHVPSMDLAKRSFILSYKQARRRDDSKGIVSAGFQVVLDRLNSDENQWKICSVCFAFGGMGSKTIVAHQTQEKLVDLPWNKETIHQAYDHLLNEMPLDDSSPGGQPEYRRTLIQSFLFKFYSYVCTRLRLPITDLSCFSFNRGVSHAQQTTPEKPEIQKIVGSSMQHRSAYCHATGEAIYFDDMPLLMNTLHGALVISTKAHARIKNINLEKASNVPGFVAFFDHRDVPGSNALNGSLAGEEVFVSSIAYCVGATIGIVVAETEQAAQTAAHLIDIDYELLSPVILSIEDAIHHDSYFGGEHILNQGDVDQCLANAEHTVEGELKIGGQEHFYMETNACMVIPSNDDDQEVTLYLPCQSPSSAQELTALVLGRDVGQITCHTKRIGGAFGGKESRSMPPCLAIAVAAIKTNRPVRLRLERHTDIAITGHRHPFKVHYKVGFNNQGQVSALDIRMWSNAGWSLDASEAVMQLAMLHMGNTYQYPNLRIRGYVCKTNLPSNTAFRGFGGPQAMMACENVMEHVAAYLKCDPWKIRQINLFQEGDRTHYGQILEHWNIPRILDELIQSSDFYERQKQVQIFNEQNTYRKRGISLIPAKFGIGFIVAFANQASALVHIYKDGSVVVSHGGIELGQGLHTKMIAIAAEVLGCDINRIRIKETATDKIHNTSPTGGSVSTDLNGMAVKDACEQLRQRLDTLKTSENETITWEELVSKAYFARLDLCGRGFHSTPNMFDFNFQENRATFNYFTQGAAVSEIELDVLTGDWHLLRVDILMDVGTSLNPQIDIGQIEGAFMQGIGLYTMEELIWGDPKEQKWIKPGELFTCGPDTYKIPSFSDVPLDFRVSLLSNSSNPRAVYSSKGIGEPPVLFGTAAFFALKQACMAYREQQGLTDYLTLHSPATVERLRMACADEFTRRVCSNDYVGFQTKGSF